MVYTIKNKSNGLTDEISKDEWDAMRKEFTEKYEIIKEVAPIKKPSAKVEQDIKLEVEKAQENAPKKPKPRKKKKSDNSESND